jgi:chromosome partitioning protein
MKTVVFAGTKGGSGRSTLAYNVALEAAKKHSVLIADVDPQRNLTDLWERRGEERNPRLAENVTSIMELITRLKRTKRTRDWLIVDCPGSLMSVLTDAVAVADVIVLPVQASPLDLTAQGAILDLIEKMGKTAHAIFALNRVDMRNDLGPQAMVWLIQHYTLPVVEIQHRAAYVRAAITGQAAGELDKHAAREIGTLWKAIQEKAG